MEVVISGDDAWWFLKSDKEIQKLKDNLTPMEFPLAERFLNALAYAKSKGIEKEFVDTFLVYTSVDKCDIIEIIKIALEDWE
jgi:hypothetical protein